MRRLLPLLLGCAIAPAGGVIILDSTWAEHGGSPDEPWAGFEAAIELAYRPQFRATVAISADDGETWGACSGTWIGNADGHGYVLTAAHCFGDGTEPEDVVVRSTGGTILSVIEGYIHEDWVDADSSTGADLAVLVLEDAVRDAGRAPLLYGGNEELGRLLTFMGYGSRGIASIGQHDDYHDGEDRRAAAQGVVDVAHGPGEGEYGGNYLGVFLPAEDGSIDNPHGGASLPVNALAGLLGSGDSGGPAWMQIGSRWVLAGVNANGTGNASAGESSWFVRVSGQREWILEHAPMARFVD